MPLFAAEAMPQVLQPEHRLAPVEDPDSFLQYPWSLDIDEQGRTLVADVLARKVFVWGRDGSYQGSIGKEGRGPGEFMFTGKGSGGFQAYVSSSRDKIYVYDGSERKLSIFGMDLAFQRSFRLNLNGRTEALFVTRNNEVLVFQRNYQTAKPLAEIAFYSQNADTKRVLVQEVDMTFSRVTRNGHLKNVVYHAYAPTLFVHYNNAEDQLVVGHTGKPYFETYAGQGRLTGSVPLKMPPRQVTKQDRAEYMEQYWLRNSKFLSADFPEMKSYYDGVLPVGQDYYLVYSQSPVERRIEGVVVDNHGRVLGRKVSLTCGEGGGIFGSRGRIMAIMTDSDGEFQIQELTLQ